MYLGPVVGRWAVVVFLQAGHYEGSVTWRLKWAWSRGPASVPLVPDQRLLEYSSSGLLQMKL